VQSFTLNGVIFEVRTSKEGRTNVPNTGTTHYCKYA